MDPEDVVAKGYDRIVERYTEWASSVRLEERERYTAVLLDNLHEGASVLELGCGSGIPTTQRLADHFRVTGVDISTKQVALARENVPEASFKTADMATLDFPPDSFDAVAAFYAITHVPREQHEQLLRSIAQWLRPDGLLVASMGAGASASDIDEDWLGAPMYFSHFDAETNRALVEGVGLQLESARVEVADEDGVDIPFLWVVARKSQSPSSRGFRVPSTERR